MRTGRQLIAEERERQIEKEKYSSNHDDKYDEYELEAAGDAYYLHTGLGEKSPKPKFWPWSDAYWKPSADQVRNLVKAGALYEAEMDRLKRSAHQDKPSIEQMKRNISEISIKIDNLLFEDDDEI